MILLYCIIILGIFLGDLKIKNMIERKDPSVPSSLWKNRILIRRHHNRGAMLNLGQGRRPLVAALHPDDCGFCPQPGPAGKRPAARRTFLSVRRRLQQYL